MAFRFTLSESFVQKKSEISQVLTMQGWGEQSPTFKPFTDPTISTAGGHGHHGVVGVRAAEDGGCRERDGEQQA